MTNLKIMTIIITGRTKYLILVLNETKEILELKGNIFFKKEIYFKTNL